MRIKCKDAAPAEPLFGLGRYTLDSVPDTECLKPEFCDLTRDQQRSKTNTKARLQSDGDKFQCSDSTTARLLLLISPERFGSAAEFFFGGRSEALGRKAATITPRLRPRSRKSPSPEVSHSSHPRIKDRCISDAPAAHRRWPGAFPSPPHLGRCLCSKVQDALTKPRGPGRAW